MEVLESAYRINVFTYMVLFFFVAEIHHYQGIFLHFKRIEYNNAPVFRLDWLPQSYLLCNRCDKYLTVCAVHRGESQRDHSLTLYINKPSL